MKRVTASMIIVRVVFVVVVVLLVKYGSGRPDEPEYPL